MSAIGPSLFAAPTVVREIAEARALAVLIGGYDGSGNYGDIAQLDAALALVERLGPDMLALPVLERQYLTTHRELIEDAGVSSPRALFFDPEGGHEDDLLPVAAPVELAFGACYLYGGGYLNHRWGARRLAMLEAAEALLEAGGVAPYRVASGLQVEAEWIAAGAGAPRRFDYLGARDAASRRALETLDTKAATTETGDDAVGPLGQVPVPAQRPADDGRPRLNLHFAEHDWASERPRALLDFYAGFVDELQRLAEQPLLVQPLIAYLDPRVDERPGVERLHRTCAERGVEVAEPLVLRPAGLAEAAPLLRAASLTLSCSYHVALTSLMLEVPAVLVADNPYYEQKAAGLRDGFALPPAFTVAATDDPTARAGEIAAKLFDPNDGEALRHGVAAGAERLRQRRARTEIELLGRLGAAATAGLGRRLEEQAERLRRRSAEPAELRVRLAALQTELEEAERPAGPAPMAVKPPVQEVASPVGAPLLEAELRAQEAEATLDTILRSRSWRLLAPLRRLGAHLRERWRNVRRPL
jgi:polysaccharide pyruvyl transferase WcaK-like protein